MDKKTLVEAPGLNTAFAISYLNMDNFQNDRDDLYKQLEQNKSRYLLRHFYQSMASRQTAPFQAIQPIFSSKIMTVIKADTYHHHLCKHANADIDDAQSLVEQLSKACSPAKQM